MLKSSQMCVIKNLIDVIPLLYCQYFCQKLIAKVEFITSFIREKKSKELQLPGQFIKDQEQNYTYTNKKVVLLVKDGQLCCKVGNSYKTFEDYVSCYIKQERSLSPKLTLSLSQRSEDSKTKKAILRKALNNSTSESKGFKRII